MLSVTQGSLAPIHLLVLPHSLYPIWHFPSDKASVTCTTNIYATIYDENLQHSFKSFLDTPLTSLEQVQSEVMVVASSKQQVMHSVSI